MQLQPPVSGGSENNLASMIADGLRIRKGDNIIFYLQSSAQDGVQEGKFYGVFQADDDWSFLDNYGQEQYLMDELDKSLTFRTLIEPKINRYIEWLKQYCPPNRSYDYTTIRPFIVGRGYSSLSSINRFYLIEAIKENEKQTAVMINYVEYRIKSDVLYFESVPLISKQYFQ